MVILDKYGQVCNDCLCSLEDIKADYKDRGLVFKSKY